jgi:hypothetical protein
LPAADAQDAPVAVALREWSGIAAAFPAPLAPASQHGTRGPTGFTVVGLIVVMLAVGVLAAVAFPRLFTTSADARLSKMGALFSSF